MKVTLFKTSVRLLSFILLATVIVGCGKNDLSPENVRFEIDRDNSSIEGSFVQNASMTSLNNFVLRYIGGGSVATVKASEVNGVFIAERQVDLPVNGTVKIAIEGKPIELGEFTLKLEVVLAGRSYFCSHIFEVAEDTDPNAPITFTLDPQYNEVTGLFETTEIPFFVDPFMSSIVVVEPFVTGLSTAVEINNRTGQGILRLTSGNNFIGGDLNFVVSFGARTPIAVTISTSPFEAGDGSAASPFEISNVELLRKLHFLPNSHFKLTENINLQGVVFQSIGGGENVPFSGTLDGNGKSISGINIVGTSNVAFFGNVSTTTVIKDLTISGTVTGTNFVAGLVANNTGTITNVDASAMIITGENNLSGLTVNNTGTITNSTPVDLLSFPNFPTMIADFTTTITRPLNFTPSTAVATIVRQPENVTATIDGANLVLTPQYGFTETDMTVVITLANVSSTEKTISLSAEEGFDAGNGSAANPWVISRASQFNKIRDLPGDNFLLAADIDLTELGSEWVPIPTFTGTIDGDGYSVFGLKHTSIATKGGLITVNTGNIRNIAFRNINMIATAAFGAIVGDHSVGTINNVVVTGTVTSTHTGDILGGVAGEILGGVISNVYVNLAITTSAGMTGGIVGRARAGASTVINCTSEGSITVTMSRTRIAGIVGRAEFAIAIRNCLSTMNISSNVSGTNGVGGIFGADNTAAGISIEESMFTGTLSNVFMSGGIAGVGPRMRNNLVVGQGTSMATPMITVGGTVNTSSAGGIAGTNKFWLENSIVRNATITGVSTVGQPLAGIVSTFQNDGFVRNSVVDNVLINGTNVRGVAGTAAVGTGVNSNNFSSGVLFYEGGTPSTYTPTDAPNGLDGGQKTASELTQSFYESLGFDFVNIWKWENNQPVLQNVGYQGTVSIN
ncbi:MAG: hypothetical protein LBI15_00195 [Dysgonamonadaceae bacterium]|jgi:hypothetical protein|nr:hypothetical protein [Dysgonamonadaceae bacterium]